MKKTIFFELEPEVAGQLSGQTQLDNSVWPPVVKNLEIHIEGWLGGRLLEAFPCFMVEESLRHALEAAQLSGLDYEPVSLTFEEHVAPEIKQLRFWRAIPAGSYCSADFSVNGEGSLVVSEKALIELQKFELGDCTFTEISR